MGRETRRTPGGRGIFELEGLCTTGARAEDDNIVTAAAEPVWTSYTVAYFWRIQKRNVMRVQNLNLQDAGGVEAREK